MSKRFHIALFASGNGSNAEAILQYLQHHPDIEVSLILSNNPDAYVLQRANRWQIPSRVFDKTQFRNEELILSWLKEREVTHIVLAGFLWLIPAYLIRQFPDRIVNIHPALLPKFGGKGMYGKKVHEAVKFANETESGITIHLVNEKYDEGKILLQKSCIISATDSVDDIAHKVQLLEHQWFPKAIDHWISGK